MSHRKSHLIIVIYAGLTYKKPLAGILALSTYLPLHKHFPEALTDANKNTPLLMCHGERDEVVKYEWAQKSHHILNKCHNSIFVYGFDQTMCYCTREARCVARFVPKGIAFRSINELSRALASKGLHLFVHEPKIMREPRRGAPQLCAFDIVSL